MGEMPRRPLGSTGEMLSIVGFGGVAVMNADPNDVRRWVADAVAAGVNYFDVAPSYGNAEELLGPALAPFRKDVFLACKTTRRDRESAWQELQGSLKRLGTDRVDLYQMHGLGDEEVEQALGPGGALEAFLKARQEGRARFLGFSSHSPKAALAAISSGLFDTVLFPVNFVLHFSSQFEVPVVAEARRRGMGILAIKALARRRWPQGVDRSTYRNCWYQPVDDRETASLALSWALEQGVTAVVPPGDISLVKMAIELAPLCGPLTEQERRRLAEIAAHLPPIFPK